MFRIQNTEKFIDGATKVIFGIIVTGVTIGFLLGLAAYGAYSMIFEHGKAHESQTK